MGGAMAHILLIEDDEGLAYALAAALTRAGHHVVTELNGMSALKTLDTDVPFDLLLTDIRLPAGQPHGVALACMARWKRPNLAVIFMTGHPDLREHVEGEKLFMKPIDPDVVLKEIAALTTSGA
jgi:DNA-binding NtrC family response regulator